MYQIKNKIQLKDNVQVKFCGSVFKNINFQNEFPINWLGLAIVQFF